MPCFNRSAFTDRTVRALAQFERRDSFTLVCVNDASTDDTADVLYRLQCEGLVDYVIDHQERKGVASSVNEAWRIGEHEASAFVKLDNDSEIQRPGLFDSLDRVMSAFGPNIGMAAPLIDPGSRPGLRRVTALDGTNAIRPDSNLNGAMLYVPRSTFERIGFFWEWKHPYSFSDAEYCFRCRRSGIDHLYLPEPPGHWVDHLDDGDRKYLAWKLRMRKRYSTAWKNFQTHVKRGRIKLHQPFRIKGER